MNGLTDKKILGNFGEAAVCKHYKKNKYKITDVNYSCYFGEIDVIAENRECLAFIEVKTRTEGTGIYSAKEAVTQKKLERIHKTAEHYITVNRVDKNIRFDVAEVYVKKIGDKLKVVSVECYENI